MIITYFEIPFAELKYASYTRTKQFCWSEKQIKFFNYIFLSKSTTMQVMKVFIHIESVAMNGIPESILTLGISNEILILEF